MEGEVLDRQGAISIRESYEHFFYPSMVKGGVEGRRRRSWVKSFRSNKVVQLGSTGVVE